MSAKTDVLLVEDNPLNQKLIVRFLEGHGYGVRVAQNTVEAEAQLAESVPAVILMDVSLPGEDGLTFTRRLRSSPGRRIPVVAVSAHAMTGDAERALEAGCDFYITKPVDLAALLSAVRMFADAGPEVA